MQRTKLNLILASASPRRKELLGWSYLPFKIVVSDIEENSSCEDPKDIVMDLASQKAEAVISGCTRDDFVIGSDTIVVFNGEILEKPKDKSDAKTMLQKLSGESHTVFTGVSFKHQNRTLNFYDKTEVSFDEIDDELLSYYLATGESMDKAGSYGIQGAALGFIANVSGSYSNVVGFPINKVIKELQAFLKTDYKGLHEIFNS